VFCAYKAAALETILAALLDFLLAVGGGREAGPLEVYAAFASARTVSVVAAEFQPVIFLSCQSPSSLSGLAGASDIG
jgi:hypothetical protein